MEGMGVRLELHLLDQDHFAVEDSKMRMSHRKMNLPLKIALVKRQGGGAERGDWRGRARWVGMSSEGKGAVEALRGWPSEQRGRQ
jgi:hypothetical protein